MDIMIAAMLRPSAMPPVSIVIVLHLLLAVPDFIGVRLSRNSIRISPAASVYMA